MKHNRINSADNKNIRFKQFQKQVSQLKQEKQYQVFELSDLVKSNSVNVNNIKNKSENNCNLNKENKYIISNYINNSNKKVRNNDINKNPSDDAYTYQSPEKAKIKVNFSSSAKLNSRNSLKALRSFSSRNSLLSKEENKTIAYPEGLKQRFDFFANNKLFYNPTCSLKKPNKSI